MPLIHNVVVNIVFSGCESGIGSECVSDNYIFFYFVMTLFSIWLERLINVSACIV